MCSQVLKPIICRSKTKRSGKRAKQYMEGKRKERRNTKRKTNTYAKTNVEIEIEIEENDDAKKGKY